MREGGGRTEAANAGGRRPKRGWDWGEEEEEVEEMGGGKGKGELPGMPRLVEGFRSLGDSSSPPPPAAFHCDIAQEEGSTGRAGQAKSTPPSEAALEQCEMDRDGGRAEVGMGRWRGLAVLSCAVATSGCAVVLWTMGGGKGEGRLRDCGKRQLHRLHVRPEGSGTVQGRAEICKAASSSLNPQCTASPTLSAVARTHRGGQCRPHIRI